MKLLVVGSGGREHALAWKLAQSPRVQMVYVAPGNGGTAQDERLKNVDITALDELADFAEREGVAFTLVGPEAPLAAGIVNLFRARGLKSSARPAKPRSSRAEGFREGVHEAPRHPDRRVRNVLRRGRRTRTSTRRVRRSS